MATKQIPGRWAPDQSCYVVLTDGNGNCVSMNRTMSYQNIAGAGTTVIKSGAGYLHRIVINKCIVASVTTLFDNIAGSGTKIATITQPALALLNSQVSLPFECEFNNGLTITTSAADDITVIYS